MSTVSASRDTSPPRYSFGIASAVSIFLGVSLGLLAASLLLPDRGLQLAGTLMGNSPKAYWYLSRGAGFVALGLLWISMILGLLITDKMARSWPGAPAAFAIHEYVSLLGLVFVAFHALILLGDRYINYRLVQVLLPFGSVNYHPVWVGLGQIGFYIWAIISATFYVRQKIGSKAWRYIHYASFFNFVVAMIHGLAAGTDHGTLWAHVVYWTMGATTLFLTIYRIAASVSGPEPRPLRKTPGAVTPPES